MGGQVRHETFLNQLSMAQQHLQDLCRQCRSGIEK
jgi:hypothetical protein